MIIHYRIKEQSFIARIAAFNLRKDLYQYQQLGTIRFLIEYLIESMRKGYYENKFEIEARNAETTTPLADFILIPK